MWIDGETEQTDKKNDNAYMWLSDGLGIRCYPTGRKTYVVHYQESKMLKIKTLAEFGAITLEQAQDLAKAFRRKLSGTASLTCDEAFNVWLVRYAKVETKTWRKQQARWTKYISPCWGQSQLITINTMDLAGLVASLYETPTMANRLMELFSSVWNRCTDWGLINLPNPCKKVSKPKLKSRSRYAEGEEAKLIMDAINQLHDWRSRDVLKLLIYTGCRKTEILSLKWASVKLESKMLILDETKNDEVNFVPLVDEALQILGNIKRTSVFVFPSDSASGHLADVHNAWQTVKATTGITDIRVHDLRRTLGSWLVQDNISADVIGDVLNHKSKQSTAVYTRMSAVSKRNALERYAELLRTKNIC